MIRDNTTTTVLSYSDARQMAQPGLHRTMAAYIIAYSGESQRQPGRSMTSRLRLRRRLREPLHSSTLHEGVGEPLHD